MKRSFEENLELYAQVLLEGGIGLRKGDGLILNFDIWGLELARKLVEGAYTLGAKDVITNFSDDAMALSRYERAEDYALEHYPGFKVDYLEAAFKDNYHTLYLGGPNPELLKKVDRKRVALWQRTSSQAGKAIQHYQMDNLVKWSVAMVPSKAWAKKVFPELTEAQGIEKLWEQVFTINRIDKKDPLEAWQRHDRLLKEKESFLNESDFERLIFQGPGTELEVYLVEGHRWIGGSSKLERGDSFIANMPTEEVFTMPHRLKVQGRVRATKPLSLQGKLIEDLEISFKEGRVVDFSATKGQETFAVLLEMDEGARYLGEVALVAEDSPLAKTGLLFYNTLYDENASCHLALGQAYGENIRGQEELSQEEKSELGMNESMVHVDFMVGSDELTITGVKKDGSQVLLLKKGLWVR